MHVRAWHDRMRETCKAASEEWRLKLKAKMTPDPELAKYRTSAARLDEENEFGPLEKWPLPEGYEDAIAAMPAAGEYDRQARVRVAAAKAARAAKMGVER